jgi:hypothetical protein
MDVESTEQPCTDSSEVSMQHRTFYKVTATAGALVVAGLGLAGGATATAGDYGGSTRGTTVQSHLNPLNNSGVTGRAKVRVEGRNLDVEYHARRLARGVPHAVHIHYGDDARHECPNVRDDTNDDFRLNVAEGLPAYGPIVKSLTTSGDTSPASALAVDRFSTAPKGKIHYHRDMKASTSVARAIRNGEGVIVVHGVDYNQNGKYDFDSAGASELDAKLPAEATDPAACGVLR